MSARPKVNLHPGKKTKIDVSHNGITSGTGVAPTASDEHKPGIQLDVAKVSITGNKMKVELTGRGAAPTSATGGAPASAKPDNDDEPPDEELPPDGSLVITLIDILGAALVPPAPPVDVTYVDDPGPGPAPGPGLSPLLKKKTTLRKKTPTKPAKKKGTKMKATKKKTTKKKATKKKPAKKPAKKRRKK